jgi:hypothetical protein
MFTTQLFMAVAVFLSIYIVFFLLIRLFSDMAIVGASLVCAGIAFLIPPYYSAFRDLFHSVGLFASIGLKLPETPTTFGMTIIATLIVMVGVLICLPFLPFSETYRTLLGVGKANITEAQVKQLITDELARVDVDDLDEKKVKQWIHDEFTRRAAQKEEPKDLKPIIAPEPEA